MKNKYRVVSVKLTAEQYRRLEEMKEKIEGITSLPISVHYLIKRSIADGCDGLVELYSSMEGSLPNTLRR
jgi:hypothetical protein